MNDITNNSHKNIFESNFQIFSENFLGHINAHYNNNPDNQIEIRDPKILSNLERFTESEVKDLAIKKAKQYIYFWAIHKEIEKKYSLSRTEEQRLIELWNDRQRLESIKRVRNSSISSGENEIRKQKLKNKTRLVQILEDKIEEFNSLLEKTIMSPEDQELLDDAFIVVLSIPIVSKGLGRFLEEFKSKEETKGIVEDTYNQADALLRLSFDVITPYGEIIKPLQIQ